MAEALMAYRVDDRPDRIKAVAGVLLVHAGLAALILSGLNVHLTERTVLALKTFDIVEPPPPRAPPPPSRTSERARDQEGAAGKKAKPTPIVAPEPQIAIPREPPIRASRIAGAGSASSAGAASAGTGTGAGGSGSGLGGGGQGDFSRFTPARMLNKIPDREYRRISSGRIPRGSAAILMRINPNGRIANCRVTRSSGDHYVDWVVCNAAMRHLRFSPARDASGQAIAYDMPYTPTWRPNY
jgi:protein TonB